MISRIRGLVRRAIRPAAKLRAHFINRFFWRFRPAKRKPHGLPGKLVVSLTSYPARFGTLAPALRGLLSQDTLADATVLWLGEGDAQHLPREVLNLQAAGLQIRTATDMGPYTKLIPSLEAYPDAFVVTADDDVYYGRRWLTELTAAYDSHAPAIVCHRAHRVRLDASGRPLSYRDWEWEVPHPETSPLLCATGVGGVLYPPGLLPGETRDAATFLALSPKGDDLWLYWMARRAGVLVKTLGHRKPLIFWGRSQRVSLFLSNVGGSTNNDVYVENLFAAYGLPLPEGVRSQR